MLSLCSTTELCLQPQRDVRVWDVLYLVSLLLFTEAERQHRASGSSCLSRDVTREVELVRRLGRHEHPTRTLRMPARGSWWVDGSSLRTRSDQVPLKQWEQVEQRGALADRGARSHLSQHPLLLPHRPCGKTQDSKSAELCSITSLALGWSPAPRSKHITTSVLEFPMKRKWYMPDQLRARLRDSHAYRQKAKGLCRHLLLFLPTAARVW